ncbi:MAG: NAD-dependent epimerase/dehydratase family protein, partial [Gaiellaceae bacterium]
MNNSEERFLVTGAGGCIGAWVVALLAREGAQVVGVDLDPDVPRLREIAGAELASAIPIERGDITLIGDLTRVMDAHEITNVIHLAALQIPFCRATPALGATVNVVGTVNVF